MAQSSITGQAYQTLWLLIVSSICLYTLTWIGLVCWFPIDALSESYPNLNQWIFGLFFLGLLLALAISHWVIHRQLVIPSQKYIKLMRHITDAAVIELIPDRTDTIVGQFTRIYNDYTELRGQNIIDLMAHVSRVAKGDMSSRVNMRSLNQLYIRFAKEINENSQAFETWVKSISAHIQSMSRGTFSDIDTRDTPPQLQATTSAIAQSHHVIKHIINDITHMSAHAAKGDFSKRITQPLSGEFSALKQHLNLAFKQLELLAASFSERAKAHAKGDLSHPPPSLSVKGLYQTTQEAFQRVTEQRIQLLYAIKQRADRFVVEGNAISDSTEQLNTKIQSQLLTLHQLKQKAQQLNLDYQQNAAIADQILNSVDSLQQLAQKNQRYLDDSLAAMQQLLGKSEAVRTATNSVKDIAFQTNMLSLNASVEAARAHSAEQGFGHVAQKIHALAARANETASDIDLSVGITHERIQASHTLVHKTHQTLSSMFMQLETVHQHLEALIQRSRDQVVDVAQLTSDIERIDNGIQSEQAALTTLASTATSVDKTAQALKQSVDQFKLPKAQA